MEERDETTGLGASPQADGDGGESQPAEELKQPTPSDPGDETDSDK